jgi:hypothetical protein
MKRALPWVLAAFAAPTVAVAAEPSRLEAEARTGPCEDEARYERVAATLQDPSIRPTLGVGVYRMGEQDPRQGNLFGIHAKLELTRGPVYVAFDERLASTQAPSAIAHELLIGYSIRSFVHDSLCDLRRTTFRVFGGARAMKLVGFSGTDFFWPVQAGIQLARASVDASAEVYGSFLWEPRLGEIGYTVGGAYVFPLIAPFDRPWLYASAELGYLGQLGIFTGVDMGLKIEY